jgi:hypothetical protein
MRPTNQLLDAVSPEQRTLLAPRIAQFYRALELQNQRDVGALASLMRTLHSPRGLARKDAELFADYVRGIVKEELSKRTD